VKVLVVGRIMLDIDKVGDNGCRFGLMDAGLAIKRGVVCGRGVDGVENRSGLLNIEGGARVWRSRLLY
jgi:hypothetical protein